MKTKNEIRQEELKKDEAHCLICEKFLTYGRKYNTAQVCDKCDTALNNIKTSSKKYQSFIRYIGNLIRKGKLKENKLAVKNEREEVLKRLTKGENLNGVPMENHLNTIEYLKSKLEKI